MVPVEAVPAMVTALQRWSKNLVGDEVRGAHLSFGVGNESTGVLNMVQQVDSAVSWLLSPER